MGAVHDIFAAARAYMSGGASSVLRADGVTPVQALVDPEEDLWEETEGGGIIGKRRTVLTDGEAALDLGEIVTYDGYTWKVAEGERNRLLGDVIGDVYVIERLFGG